MLTRRQYRAAVQARLSFKGNNVFAISGMKAYVVYSYGTHWPLFAYIGGQWYENTSKYGPTTSQHRGYCHPHEPTIGLPTEQLKALIES